MKNLITLLLIISINFGANSLELTLPITIYENLSKNVNPIVGSSTLTIDREEFSSKTNNLFHEILEFNSGIFGLPLRLLAREVYDKCVKKIGLEKVALITGEEKIIPNSANYFICTVIWSRP